LEVSGQLHATAALPPGKDPRYPLDRRLGGPQSRSGRFGAEKILDPTGTRVLSPSVVQPVASRYTDYAISAPVPCHSVRNYIVPYRRVSRPLTRREPSSTPYLLPQMSIYVCLAFIPASSLTLLCPISHKYLKHSSHRNTVILCVCLEFADSPPYILHNITVFHSFTGLNIFTITIYKEYQKFGFNYM
jgi:hypothetical protein